MIYLDNAATTYPKPEEVYEIMDRTNRNCAFNTGRGSYKAARKLNELLENTRDKIVNLVYGDCHNVVFTPSVTIALNQIINGLEAVNSKMMQLYMYRHMNTMQLQELLLYLRVKEKA